MYNHVLDKPLEGIDALRAKKPIRIPIVLSKDKVRRLLNNIEQAQHQLMAKLMYGSGIRCIECIRLRVLDVDFERSTLNIFEGKGAKDRLVPLDDSLHEPLKRQIAMVKQIHETDLSNGYGAVYLPHALAKKNPNAPKMLSGNTCSPPLRSRSTRVPASNEGTISTKAPSAAPSPKRPKKLA